MIRNTICFLCLFFLVLINPLQAEEINISEFAKDTAYSNVKLSPLGDYISLISKPEGKNVLIILDAKRFAINHVVRFGDNGQVGRYSWVNNERIVLEKEYIRGWKSHPEYRGELFGVNADGSKGRYLVGYQGEMQTGSRVKKATPLYGTSYILDPLINEEDYLLIYTIPWSRSTEPSTVVYKVNVNKGTRRRVASSPKRMGYFLTDHQGHVRVSVSSADGISSDIFIRSEKKKEWQPLKLDGEYTDIDLIAFSKSGDEVYFRASTHGEPEGVFKLSLETKKILKVFQDNEVAPKQIWVDDFSKELFAIEIEPGYPTYVFPNKNTAMAQRLKAMLEAIPGNQIHIVSSTLKGELSVIYASSDVNPGSYYLYKAKENKLQFLFSAKVWLKPELMAETKPIKFTSRDGLIIHGYLTLPNNIEPKDLPLVVMPHGGPHGPRDWWGFDSDVQVLANRGIAVLRVNFRGSGGYGSTFEHAGHRKWGAEIQYDIIDGVKHVIEKGYVNADRMCIMGASFGGYSALQSSIIEPDMFKCAIGVVGVYDLPLMFEEGDVSRHNIGQRFLTKVLGTEKEQLIAFSPSYNINKLKAPVLIVHGGEDERAPIEQAESLIKALKKANHPYVYELLEDEGHGFYKPKHREKYYKQVLSFLDKHLKLSTGSSKGVLP